MTMNKDVVCDRVDVIGESTDTEGRGGRIKGMDGREYEG